MAAELQTFAKVSFAVAASMSYARFAASRTHPGKHRLLALFPVLLLLLYLPWCFTSFRLRATSAFFLSWLATFKLLLLSSAAAGSPLSPSDPLLHFILSSSLPVKLKTPSSSSSSSSNLSRHIFRSAAFCALSAAVVSLYRSKDALPQFLLLALYCLHIYLTLESILAVSAVAADLLLPTGLELEPQADQPYRAASLREFWGRRWNLMVSAILRPSVYLPVRARWGAGAGVFATFVLSGIMHEIMFFYGVLTLPTGEATAFFVLHGLCVLVENKARRSTRWRPPRAVAVPLTLGFVLATAYWLFFPPLMRNGVLVEAALAEHEAVVELMESARRAASGGMRLFWRACSLFGNDQLIRE